MLLSAEGSARPPPGEDERTARAALKADSSEATQAGRLTRARWIDEPRRFPRLDDASACFFWAPRNAIRFFGDSRTSHPQDALGPLWKPVCDLPE